MLIIVVCNSNFKGQRYLEMTANDDNFHQGVEPSPFKTVTETEIMVKRTTKYFPL